MILKGSTSLTSFGTLQETAATASAQLLLRMAAMTRNAGAVQALSAISTTATATKVLRLSANSLDSDRHSHVFKIASCLDIRAILAYEHGRVLEPHGGFQKKGQELVGEAGL